MSVINIVRNRVCVFLCRIWWGTAKKKRKETEKSEEENEKKAASKQKLDRCMIYLSFFLPSTYWEYNEIYNICNTNFIIRNDVINTIFEFIQHPCEIGTIFYPGLLSERALACCNSITYKTNALTLGLIYWNISHKFISKR